MSDNVVDMTGLMAEVASEPVAEERQSAERLTEKEIDAILGRPPASVKLPKARTFAWYDFASRFPGKLEPRHADTVAVYSIAFCNHREVTKELDAMPTAVRFSSEYRDFWVRQKDFIAQMESAHKMIMGTKLGRPAAKTQK